ncbi:MAG: bifunctional phosphoribosylaminoimidazolecarboxamide formyltransferase/IMP cyclohydrolase [Bacteriovoracaceae bacterium]|nr:bifunctional phosphoribosylaminoimidazolecarboxamide formyltransferase/IMP cyclohydrolase [Bacteriovoracaceae bacterium]
MTKIRKALLSVSDKEGILSLGKFLSDNGVEIISSGGTRKALEAEGIKVTAIETVTGNPEAFGGRMKTLSFQVSSALLFRREHTEDIKTAKELEIEAIDLVVCNLYPFVEVAKKNGDFSELIENIDIGGPTMVRAAAKNHESVTVLTNPSQYGLFVDLFNKGNGAIENGAKAHFALEAFRHTAEYDSFITETLQERLLGSKVSFHGHSTGPYAQEVRYGENPHQKGFVIKGLNTKKRIRLAEAEAIQGKALSYNNYLDADASWRCNSDLHMLMPQKYCVTVVKHSNPCGAAVGDSALEALKLAWLGDPVSAFGSIITFNKELDGLCAEFLSERFVEVIMAPEFSKDSLVILSKKKNLRLIKMDPETQSFDDLMVRTIDGGFVVQQEDNGQEKEIKTVVGEHAALNNSELINFGLKVTKHLKSNAISLVKIIDGKLTLIGAGMGNPNRLVSLKQAVEKARENGHENLNDALLVSDAFFPFRDNIDECHKYGIKAIIQPGGSIKDKEVIDACSELGVAMAFTGMRHFRH